MCLKKLHLLWLVVMVDISKKFGYMSTSSSTKLFVFDGLYSQMVDATATRFVLLNRQNFKFSLLFFFIRIRTLNRKRVESIQNSLIFP